MIGKWKRVLLVAVLLLTSSQAIRPQAGPTDARGIEREPVDSAEATQRLEGAWLLDVTPTSIEVGPLQPPFKGVLSFTREGGVVGSDTSVLPPGIKATFPVGEWARIGNREFSMTFVLLLSSDGQFAGTSKLRSTLQLSENGETFTGEWRADVTDPGGNQINSLRGVFEGKHIRVEPLQ